MYGMVGVAAISSHKIYLFVFILLFFSSFVLYQSIKLHPDCDAVAVTTHTRIKCVRCVTVSCEIKRQITFLPVKSARKRIDLKLKRIFERKQYFCGKYLWYESHKFPLIPMKVRTAHKYTFCQVFGEIASKFGGAAI